MEDQDKKFDQPDDQPQRANQDSNALRTLAVDDYTHDDSLEYNSALIQDFARLFDTSVPDGIRRTTLLLLFLLSTVWLWNTVQQGFLKEESSSMGLLQLYEQQDAKEDIKINPQNKISSISPKLIDKRRRTSTSEDFSTPNNQTQSLISNNNLNEMNTSNIVSGNNNSSLPTPASYLVGVNETRIKISYDENNDAYFNNSNVVFEDDFKAIKIIIEKSYWTVNSSSCKIKLNDNIDQNDIKPINIIFKGKDSGVYATIGDDYLFCSGLEEDEFVSDRPKMISYSSVESNIKTEKIENDIEVGGYGLDFPVSTRNCKSQYKLKTRLPIRF